jgi:hypothetical protein
LEIFYRQKNVGITNEVTEQHGRQLEVDRNKLLLEEEESWRQKSRAIWIKSGDKNTKFFHNFASYRRNKKFLWEIRDEDGNVHTGQEAIKKEVVSYFHTFFKDQGQTNIQDQLAAISLYPRIVQEEEVATLERVVTMEEILEVLKGFSKDKSPWALMGGQLNSSFSSLIWLVLTY